LCFKATENAFSRNNSRLDRSETYIPDGAEKAARRADFPGRPAYDVEDGIAGSEKGIFVATRHKTVKKVTEDIYKCNFNTAVAALMEYVNELYKTGAEEEDLITLAKLLKPFAPHLASEMLENLGADDEWPQWDEKYLASDTVELVIQVNGKLRAKLTISANELDDEDTITKKALKDKKIQKYTENGIKKTIFVKKAKLLNIVV
jgi:leucyl-tRNA synthetase